MSGDDSKYGATAPLLGYLYQCRQALLLGITTSKNFPGLFISIERFDDVTVENSQAPLVQMQLKHHVKPANLTDGSKDIWKTLRIWSEQVGDNPLAAIETRFVLFTTGEAAAGTAAALLRPARTVADQDAALALLEAAARDLKSEETKPGRAAFMDLTPAARRALVSSIIVFDRAPNITNTRSEIEDLLSFSVPMEHVSSLVDHLEGWWFSRIVQSLVNTQQQSISLLSLRGKIDELAASIKSGDLLLSPDIKETIDLSVLPPDTRIFVRQLHKVSLSQSAIDRAKRDYYRATTQRSAWARENALLDGEAQRYDDGLVDRWERECEAASDANDLSSDDKKIEYGRGLFHWANRSQVPFRNRHEAWLTTGSYHVLADALRLGWHPDFRTEFATSK